MPQPKKHPSPLNILILITLTIFVVEGLLMIILHSLDLPPHLESILDSFTLILFIAPALYIFLYRPFVEIIADLRQNEENLAEKSAYLDGILRSSREMAIVATDMGLKISYFNPAAEKTFGYKAEEVIGRTVMEIHTKANVDPSRLDAAIEVVKKEGEHKFSFELEAGGKTLHYDSSISGIWDRNKELVGFVHMLMDVTEQREAEKEREALIADLNESNEELKNFAYVVSHDLKTPLRAIHNYSDFLREDLDGKLEPEQRDYLEGLARAVRQSEELVNDLLQLSRVSRQDISIKKIDPGHLLRDLTHSLDLPPDVEVLIEDKWPEIESEPILLQRIFSNLITNAVKFNNSPNKLVKLGWNDADGDPEFFVKDNGIGIESRFFDRILRPFQRLHTTREFEGTGIGLAIVVKAVQRLNGSMRIESKHGEGSAFFVKLPKRLHT